MFYWIGRHWPLSLPLEQVDLVHSQAREPGLSAPRVDRSAEGTPRRPAPHVRAAPSNAKQQRLGSAHGRQARAIVERSFFQQPLIQRPHRGVGFRPLGIYLSCLGSLVVDEGYVLLLGLGNSEKSTTSAFSSILRDPDTLWPWFVKYVVSVADASQVACPRRPGRQAKSVENSQQWGSEAIRGSSCRFSMKEAKQPREGLALKQYSGRTQYGYRSMKPLCSLLSSP